LELFIIFGIGETPSGFGQRDFQIRRAAMESLGFMTGTH
jgi:hypothetical protein